MSEYSSRLMELTGLSKSYCDLCEGAPEYSKEEFVDHMLDVLPRLYWNFFDITPGVSLGESDYLGEYVDEDMYESIRRGISVVMGASDTFLETFEEDMKYSDTPITSSISECLADLYQPLFNFVSVVHDSEGSQLEEAFIACKESFETYWSQTLCNVLRALNNIKYHNEEEEF